jgi:hypothetical protein
MDYEINLYKISKDNSSRFLLGNVGEKNLFVVGLNPSTASEDKPDLTLSKVIGFATKNNYDGFVMLNLYPKRATDPTELPKVESQNEMIQNFSEIKNLLEEFEGFDILASWGENITRRDYLTKSLIEINQIVENSKGMWKKIGELTKSGHPRHPSRIAYSEKINEFNMTEYIKKLKK